MAFLHILRIMDRNNDVGFFFDPVEIVIHIKEIYKNTKREDGHGLREGFRRIEIFAQRAQTGYNCRPFGCLDFY